jgi:negative regulator of flagellin synthesis FlgM
MKIENSVKTVGAVPVADDAARPAKTEQDAKVESAGNDRVQLELQDIEKSLAGGEVFDAARVEQIKQAIANGEFQVNTDKVADRLIETVRELIQAKKD